MDSFYYTAADSQGLSDTVAVTVMVAGVNDQPTAEDDPISTDFDRPLTIAASRLLANDSDPDKTDMLRITGMDPSGTVGAVTVTADGMMFYDSSGRFDFLATGETATDRFTYAIPDGHGGFDTATVTVTVTNTNEPPVASDDVRAADEDSIGRIAVSDLLINDMDPDKRDTLTVTAVDDSDALGRATLNAGGTIVYDPNGHFDSLAAGETATDSFRYRVSGGHGGTATAKVTVAIAGVNDAPMAADDGATTDEDAALTISASGLLANDRAPDASDRLVVTAVDTRSTVGRVTLNGDGTIAYDPRGRFDGLRLGETATGIFSYTVEDGKGGIDTASVTVTVTGLNDVPPRIERLLESFESGISPQNRSGSVTATDRFQEPDRFHGVYHPTAGDFMAFLEAYGATRPGIERFLGLPISLTPPFALPQDNDGTFAAAGSALKLDVAVAAGDEISFDWMFDGGDQLPDNDFAVFTVSDIQGASVFKLSDIRHTGDAASGWRSSVYSAEASGNLTIGFSVVNDRIGHPKGSFEASRLLVDSLRLNREFGDGYQVVDIQDHGTFQTMVHT